MQNTANTIVFNSLSEEDTDPLAKKLFTGVVNPDQIKHVFTTMRVVNYVDEEIESFSQSETHGHTTNRSHTSSSSSTSSFSLKWAS